MTQSTREITIWDVELKVEFEYSPIIPAKISGPPEDCHPEEGGELEVLDVFIDNWQVTDMLNFATMEAIKEKLQSMLGEIQAEDAENALAEQAEANRCDED